MFNLFDLKNGTDLDSMILTYIKDNMEAVAYMRVRELADATHVSPATIIRFSKKLGFENFPELRIALRQTLEDEKHILKDEAKRRTLLSHEIFPKDYDEKIEQLVKKLLDSDLIHCTGIGSSGIMAEYAAKQFSGIGFRSFASTSPYVPYLHIDKQKYLGKEICLIFSVSGETFEMVQIAKILKKSPVYAVSITNKKSNTLEKLTDLNIYYDSSYDRLYYNVDISSQLPVVFTIETLVKKLYILNKERNNYIE